MTNRIWSDLLAIALSINVLNQETSSQLPLLLFDDDKIKMASKPGKKRKELPVG